VQGSHGSQLTLSDRLELILEFIKRSRRAMQQSRLDDEELVETARAIEEMLGPIPTHRLEDCYREAMRERETKGPLTFLEILAAWRKLRAEERAIGPSPILPAGAFPPAPFCRYCDDHGWQAVDQAERAPYRYSVRACICDRTPQSMRNKEPLAEPYWEKLPSGRWKRC
jgi:hypothetical protein